MGPQMCRSTNRQVDPEVWFRIAHLAQNGHNGAPVSAYREQMVEIALGPQRGVRKRQHRHPDAPGTYRFGGKRHAAPPG
jgi:hypothetical protein